MNPLIPTVKLSYDKLKNGNYSVKLRICLGTQRTRFHLPIKEGVVVAPADYEKLVQFHQSKNKRRVPEDVRLVYQQMAPFIEKAEKLCDSIVPFSFSAFEAQFYNTVTVDESTSVLSVLAELVAEMNAQARPGNADAFQSAASSIKRFVAQFTPAERETWLGRKTDTPLQFAHVTAPFLEAYEAWMRRAGKLSQKKGGSPSPASLTSVGIYTRSLRAAFNRAIEKKIVSQDQYPFGQNGYVVAAGRNPKKALTKDMVRQILNFEVEPGSMQERSRDLWVLSYLSNGLNFADLCELRWSQISYRDETITVVRKKTSRTQRGNQVKIVAELFPESRAIIERWAGSARGSNDLVFPFLNAGDDVRKQRDDRRLIIKTTNKYMTRIGEALGIAEEVKTYSARHSFGTILLKSGADLNTIKNRLGHSSLKMTELYLSDFEDKEVKELVRNSLL